jgi:pyruvate-formate lyase-activating enzyme
VWLEKMKTKRALVINDCLVHGICNFNCRTCTVNKDVYQGPKAYQTRETYGILLERIREAAAEGINIRYLALSGDGEPTLHPDFKTIADMTADFVRGWKINGISAPEVALITNGSKLLENKILQCLEGKPIGLKISFPTVDPEHYGEIMVMDSKRGKELQEIILPNIVSAMKLHAEGKIANLEFHIAPPYMEYVKGDLPSTLDFLSKLASENGLRKLRLTLFPAQTNRAGRLGENHKKIERFKEIFQKYHRKLYNNVEIMLSLSLDKFFQGPLDFVDLLKSFDYPCFWYSNLFITAAGDSVCCNDQSALEKDGNIFNESIKRIMEIKEKQGPLQICRSCNQSPEKLSGAMYLSLHRFVTRMKMKRRQT